MELSRKVGANLGGSLSSSSLLSANKDLLKRGLNAELMRCGGADEIQPTRFEPGSFVHSWMEPLFRFGRWLYSWIFHDGTTTTSWGEHLSSRVPWGLADSSFVSVQFLFVLGLETREEFFRRVRLPSFSAMRKVLAISMNGDVLSIRILALSAEDPSHQKATSRHSSCHFSSKREKTVRVSWLQEKSTGERVAYMGWYIFGIPNTMEGIDNGKAIIPVLRQLLSENCSYSGSKTISFYERKRNWRTFMTSKMGKRRVSEIGRAMMAIRGLRCKRKHRFERNICRRPEKFDPIFSLGACQELFILQSSDEATRQILNYKIGIT